MRRCVAAWSSLALAAALAFSGDARADARTEARTHFKRGMQSIADGRYDEGIAELERAYEILPHPNVLYNIARAHVEAGNLEEAIAVFKRYLETNPPDRDDVEKIVGGLEARLKRQQAALAATREPTEPNGGATGGGGGATGPNSGGNGANGGASGPNGAGNGAAGGTHGATGGANGANGPNGSLNGPNGGGNGAASGGSGATGDVNGANRGAAGAGGAVDVRERTEDVFAETVVTASRAAQSPLDAPSSTSIITAQDIRLSGITKIPELLRRLAGVDMMEDTGAQTEVSIRGFNQRLSNKILVLVDGRSVYVDLLGATFWSTLTIAVEDIDRIEVVRGPGSALYGADAFAGVVNIITKRPGEGGSGVVVGGGDHAQIHGAAWASSPGRDGSFAWRVGGGYDDLPRWSREVPPGRADLRLVTSDQDTSARMMHLNLRGSRRFGKDVVLDVGGGISQGSLEILGIGPLNDIVLTGISTSDATVSLSSKDLSARVFWNRVQTPFGLDAAPIGQTLLPGHAEQNVVDAEVQYTARFKTGPIDHALVAGLAYRYKGVDWTYLDRFRVEHHEALFFHEEARVGQRFAVVLDDRLDFVPYEEAFVTSPRGSVLVHPSKLSTVRATVATAYRTPTFLEAYLAVPVQLPIAGGMLQSEGSRSDDKAFRVQPERILTAELGYANQENEHVAFDATAYWERASSLIQLAANRAITVGDLAAGLGGYDAQTGLYPLFFGGFDNQCQRYDVFGSEVGVRLFPVEGLDLYANYTLNIVRQDDSDCTAAERATVVDDARTSTHKVNAGVQLRTRAGIDGSVDFHFVSPQTWAEQVVNVQAARIEYQAFPLDAYTLLNARVGYHFGGAEISATAFNLLGTEHREHPFGQLLGRRVMGFFAYRF